MRLINKKVYYISAITMLACLLVGLFPYFALHIQLNGNNNIDIEYKDVYHDEGATATLLYQNVGIKVNNHIDTSKIGKQEVIYQVTNKLGTIKSKRRVVTIVDTTSPILTLIGEKTLIINQGEKYIDPGYKLIDNVDGNISSHVIIKGKVDTRKTGIYKLVYKGEDSSKNQVETARTVKVIPKELLYQTAYDEIDNSARTWWSGNKKNQQRPLTGAAATIEDLKPYNAYYLGPDEKVIYLTFDEGSNDTYVKETIEVLNQHNVKGTFFFCNSYIVDNPNIMKLLVKSGHSVGNHTAHHESMYKFANRETMGKFIKEIRETEDSFYQITGKQLDKVYREPRGDWSYRSLQIVKDMGYKSFFWSADYLDWDGDVLKEEALVKLLAKQHNGAIYLIHPKNKGNYLALHSFITQLKSAGYQFGLVKDINK